MANQVMAGLIIDFFRGGAKYANQVHSKYNTPNRNWRLQTTDWQGNGGGSSFSKFISCVWSAYS